MASQTGGSYPPVLDHEVERERLVQVVKDWTIAHGLAVRPPPAVAGDDPKGILAMSAPVTLFPSPFPASCFEEAKAVQTAYNDLYARISQDEEFLGGLVQEVAGGDDFIANLWNVHERVKKEGYVQSLSLGLFRSDYMVHKEGDDLQIKQVEFNTIASSFGGLSAQTSLLHKHLAKNEYPLLQDEHASIDPKALPDNESARGLAAGLEAAFKAYGESELGHRKCVLFITQDGERNVFDQRHLEYRLSDHGVPVFRLPFSQILAHTSIADTPKRQLLYRLPSGSSVFEAAVVYLRAGYGPSDYPEGSSAWEARYQIERSAAVVCPTVLTQLAGMKKVQQVLATPYRDDPSRSAALSRFVDPSSSPRDYTSIWRTFTNIYPLDEHTPAGQLARRLATDPEQCQRYVMKPQREGGGNNFYRSAIPRHLATLPKPHWSSFILMELITPPPLQNTILRQGLIEQGGVICELGVYGTCLWDQQTGEVLHNAEAGYLLRTKGDQSEEGGVAAGFGCMDSVYLV